MMTTECIAFRQQLAALMRRRSEIWAELAEEFELGTDIEHARELAHQDEALEIEIRALKQSHSKLEVN